MSNKFEEAKQKGSDFLSSFVFRYSSEMTAKEFYPSLMVAIDGFLLQVAGYYNTEVVDGRLLIEVEFMCACSEYAITVSEDCLTLRLKELRRDGHENMWTASDRYQFEELFEDFCDCVGKLKNQAEAHADAR